MKKVFLLLAAATILSMSYGSRSKPAEGAASADASHAFGMAIANNFKELSIDLD